jgi:GNAT superfamily N-acetyltransferase
VPGPLVVRVAARSAGAGPEGAQTRAADDLAAVFDVDDDATRRYTTAGVVIDLAADHPFVLAEQARWVASLHEGNVFLAEEDGAVVGIAVLGTVDGAPYLDQLSVRMEAMGRGVGSALLGRAVEWAASRSTAGLFLTTYDHLAWNLPFYARRGFAVVPEREWGLEMRAIVRSHRECLPDPERRAVMWRPGGRCA